MRFKILGSYWYTPMNLPGQVGVIAVKSGPASDYWKCYLGVIMNGGVSQSYDEQFVAANGAKVTKEVAVAHFPDLDPDKFIF